MRKLLKHSCALIPALLLAVLIVAIPQLDNRELILPTQSGKSFGLLGGMLGYVVVVLIIAALKRENVRIRLTVVDVLLAVYSLLVIVSYWRHPTEPLHVLCFGALVVFYLGVRAVNRKYQLLLLFAVAISGTFQAIYGNLQLWGYYPSNHGIFRMTGSFFNPGPFAGYLAAILPISLGLYLTSLNVRIFDRFSNSEASNPSNLFSNPSNSEASNNQTTKSSNLLNKIPVITRYFYNNSQGGDTPEKQAERISHTLDTMIHLLLLISILAMCLVLPASRSRAAWLAAVASAGYLLWVKYLPLSHLREWVNTTAKRFLLVFALIILLISTGAGLYYFKKDSADGRLLIWKVSAQMIKDKPILGHGSGKFAADYMNYQAAYFKPHPDISEAIQADNVTYSYNEFLKITVENGLIGLLVALAVLWSLFFGKSEKRQKLKNPILLAARGGLISILVFAMFSYPSEILPIKMLFVLFMAIVASHQSPIRLFRLGRKENVPVLSQKATLAGTAVLYAALAIALLAVYPAGKYIKRHYQAYKTWKDAADIYNVGAYPECLKDFELAYPHLKTNGQFLVQYGKALEMAEKYESSIAILIEAKQHLNNTILYTCLGNNNKALGKHTEAEQAYLHAWHMNPSRFYPLYLLAKLYDETGQKEKANEVAKELLEKDIKIESTAIEEIKEEMRTIIEKSESGLLNKNKTQTSNNLTPIYKGTKEEAYRSVALTGQFILQKW